MDKPSDAVVCQGEGSKTPSTGLDTNRLSHIILKSSKNLTSLRRNTLRMEEPGVSAFALCSSVANGFSQKICLLLITFINSWSSLMTSGQWGILNQEAMSSILQRTQPALALLELKHHGRDERDVPCGIPDVQLHSSHQEFRHQKSFTQGAAASLSGHSKFSPYLVLEHALLLKLWLLCPQPTPVHWVYQMQQFHIVLI